jgi:membrane protein DedA with SNARE-associated domain
MLEGATEWLVWFVRSYGYPALFLFIVLETAWIVHFVPSEIVIPATAAYLVTDPASFAAFVGLMTVGAVVGSLLAYYIFGVNGEVVLRRYGHVVRVPESEIERSQAWFARWGEGLLFWGRVVPVLRTPISVPAGFARTDLRRFTVYSAGGWLIYNAALVWLVYGGTDETAPVDAAVAWLARLAGRHGVVPVATAGLAAVVGAGLLWRRLSGRVGAAGAGRGR